MSAIDAIKEAKNIIVLTGAGISTAAGIPDFRTKHGLFTKYNPNDLVAGTEIAAEFIEEINTLIKTATPTPAHTFCVDLWKLGKLRRGIYPKCRWFAHVSRVT